MSHFSDLSPDNFQLTSFWEKHLPNIKELIKEIDRDVLNGWGEIEEDIDWSAAIANIYPPNIIISYYGVFDTYLLIVSNSPNQGRIRIWVPVENGGVSTWKMNDIEVKNLISGMRAAIKYWFDRGLLSDIKTRLEWLKSPIPFEDLIGYKSHIRNNELIGIINENPFNFFQLEPFTKLHFCSIQYYSPWDLPPSNICTWYPDKSEIVEFFSLLISKGYVFISEDDEQLYADDRKATSIRNSDGPEHVTHDIKPLRINSIIHNEKVDMYSLETGYYHLHRNEETIVFLWDPEIKFLLDYWNRFSENKIKINPKRIGSR